MHIHETFFQKIKKGVQENKVLFIFACGVLLLHMNCPTNLSDDSIHRTRLRSQSIFDVAYDLYFNVNGKILPDLSAAIFSYTPSIFWKVLDTLMYLVIAYCIYRIFLSSIDNTKKEYHLLCACLMTLFLPLSLIASAGYVAGSTNYIWTSSMLLLACLPIKKSLKNENFSGGEYCLYLLATLYACSQEQSMALLITFSFLIILYCFTKKIKLSKYIYVQTIFSIVCMILMFISPGHQARTDAYSQFRIPDYPMLNLIDKIHLGITSTCSYFIGNFRYIFAFFSLLLFICLRKKYKNKCALFFGSIPLIWNVLLFVCPSIFETLYRSYPYNSYGQSDFAYITVSTYQDFQYYTPIIVSIIIGVSILADMILIFDSFETQILSCLILLGGFISRVIMGLSPTLYGSADRTFSFMYISFIIVGTMLLKEIGSRNEDKNLLIIAAVMAGMGI